MAAPGSFWATALVSAIKPRCAAHKSVPLAATTKASSGRVQALARSIGDRAVMSPLQSFEIVSQAWSSQDPDTALPMAGQIYRQAGSHLPKCLRVFCGKKSPIRASLQYSGQLCKRPGPPVAFHAIDRVWLPTFFTQRSSLDNGANKRTSASMLG